LVISHDAAYVPWQRIIVAKIEGGRRDFLTVEELLALCVVLEISPTDLLVPQSLRADQQYRVAPNAIAPAQIAYDWIRGEDLLFYTYDQEERVSNPIEWMRPDRAQQLKRSMTYNPDDEDRS
jgi:hypothetical protein